MHWIALFLITQIPSSSDDLKFMDWANKPNYMQLFAHALLGPILYLFPFMLTIGIDGVPAEINIPPEKIAHFVAPTIITIGLIAVTVDLIQTWKDQYIAEGYLPFTSSVSVGLASIHGLYEIYGRPVNQTFKKIAYITLALTILLLLKKIRLIYATKKILATR